MDDAALLAYRRELEYLRSAGQSFARKYPKIAARLELSQDGSSDPHVERLIESFAYITSRIQRRLDADFPEFTSALLGLLYPSLVDPIPPMTIVQMTADKKQGKPMEGYPVPRQTALFARTKDITCRFRTAFDTTLWPLAVTEAGFVSRNSFDFLDGDSRAVSVLRMQVETLGPPFAELKPSQLRFHLTGSRFVTSRLYDLLLGHCTGVVLLDAETGKTAWLPPSAIQPVGFAPQDAVIPGSPTSHHAYRLLQEYFWLPEKFLFFDLSGLAKNPSPDGLEIFFLFNALPPAQLPVTRGTFALGCTPVVNLFERLSEPIRLDHTTTEYRLVPDARRDSTTEIHTVRSVSLTAYSAEASKVVQPFYSVSGASAPGEYFWYGRRADAERTGISGTDMYLSFVDLNFQPRMPPASSVVAQILCTNRALAVQLQVNSLLYTEEPSHIAQIHCLSKPTAPGYPPIGDASRWALISNLSLNALSLSDGDEKKSLLAFKQILSLYSLSSNENARSAEQQIASLEGMRVRRITRRKSNVPGLQGGGTTVLLAEFRRGPGSHIGALQPAQRRRLRRAVPGGSAGTGSSVRGIQCVRRLEDRPQTQCHPG